MKNFILAALLTATFGTANAGLLDSKQSLVCDTARAARAVSIARYMEINGREHDKAMPAGCHYEVATVEATSLYDQSNLTIWVLLSNDNQLFRPMPVMDVPLDKVKPDLQAEIKKMKTPEKK